MTRCSRCHSKLEDWELIDGRCPFCFPRQIVKTRALTPEEFEAVIEAGCLECKVPWKSGMGVFYCETCSGTPQTHIRIA